jgi:hypothetical protein
MAPDNGQMEPARTSASWSMDPNIKYGGPQFQFLTNHGA